MREETLELASLWERHAAAVRRFGLLLSGDPAEAEDLTAETFLRVWGARHRVDLGSVRSYLFAIARNLFLQGRRRVVSQLAGAKEPRDPAAGPERRTLMRDELGAVLEALQSLPEDDRTAIVLRAREGLAYEEIGRILGVSAAAARVRVHRARRKLGSARNPKGVLE